MKKKFMRYVSLNIAGMVGLSCYILADSYFISKAQGADGLTALNLALPIYNIIFAVGSMIGTGSAIRYTIARSRNHKDADNFIFNAVFFTVVIGLLFSITGLLFSDNILTLFGADKEILSTGRNYTKIFMSCSPFFMLNFAAGAFVRNDGAPNTAMAATLISSIFNIIFDYIFMFPLKMGMSGAALATGLSPVIGIIICSTHLFSKKSTVKIKPCVPSVSKLIYSCKVGVSAFVAEISSGVITMTFNFLILKEAGNFGVAAYGIVANIALVAVAFSNGVAQGSQPLISSSYGKKKPSEVRSLVKMSLVTSFLISLSLYIILAVFAVSIAGIFNSEGNAAVAEYAKTGIRIYFIGILFSGINITGSSCFSAVENVKAAFAVSILRGFVLIIFFAFILASLFGMNGIWSAYAAAEFSASLVMLFFSRRKISAEKSKKQSDN